MSPPGPEASPRRRMVGLAPMIDVVFLLLLFFLLTARVPMAGLPVSQAEQGGAGGPPRVVTVTPDQVRLNGADLPVAELGRRLRALAPEGGGPVAVRAESGATVQRLIDILDRLAAAGLDDVTVLE